MKQPRRAPQINLRTWANFIIMVIFIIMGIFIDVIVFIFVVWFWFWMFLIYIPLRFFKALPDLSDFSLFFRLILRNLFRIMALGVTVLVFNRGTLSVGCFLRLIFVLLSFFLLLFFLLLFLPLLFFLLSFLFLFFFLCLGGFRTNGILRLLLVSLILIALATFDNGAQLRYS